MSVTEYFRPMPWASILIAVLAIIVAIQIICEMLAQRRDKRKATAAARARKE